MVSRPQLLESVTYVLKFSTVAYATWADKWADISLGTFLWDIMRWRSPAAWSMMS